MTLREFLTLRKINFTEAARELEDTPRNVQRHATGARIPRPVRIRRYAEWSGGLVQPGDWYAADEPAERAA